MFNHLYDLQVHSASEKSNGETPNDSNGNANGGTLSIPGLFRKSVEDKAASRIQKAFRAYRVNLVTFLQYFYDNYHKDIRNTEIQQ